MVCFTSCSKLFLFITFFRSTLNTSSSTSVVKLPRIGVQMLGVSFNLVIIFLWIFFSSLPIMGLVFTNYSALAKADLSGWYFDSKTSVCSSSLRKYKAMASEFLAQFVFKKYFPLIFHKCSKIFFEGITPRKGPLSTILERAHAMKFTQKPLHTVCSTKRDWLATA